MLEGVDYTGYTVIVKKIDSQETLLQTKIMDHNRQQRSIFIQNLAGLSDYTGKLMLIILGGEAIHEYFGTPRKTANPNRIEISLFKGKEKEDRVAKRYDLYAEAVISDIKSPTFDMDLEQEGDSGNLLNAMLAQEKRVKLLNLSSRGALIHTEFGVLQNEDTFKLKLDIAGSATIIFCKVLRIENAGDGNVHCGCKFISANT